MIDAVLTARLAGAPAIALLDFPNYANVGDSAIWLGEIECIRALTGRVPDYTCAFSDYDAEALIASAPEGPILLSGGGNFGDLYDHLQNFRERVCVDFPDRPIIQLPQTIHFRDEARLDHAKRIFSSHPGFLLLTRDRRSNEIAGGFGCESALVPDMAFYLGAIRPRPPHKDVVAVLRSDLEAIDRSPVRDKLPDGTRVADWLIEGQEMLEFLQHYVAGRSGETVARCRVAESRLSRGLGLLSSGRRVVTDRLHGHILSLVLGLPNFVLDNSYGKNSSFIETWTLQSGLTTMGETPEALEHWLRQSAVM